MLASAANVARVYKVGPREANAIVQLSQKVTEPIQALLKDAVRKRGMRSFLTHEAIGKEIFSLAWTSGSGQYDAWNDALSNKDDNELVSNLNYDTAHSMAIFVSLKASNTCLFEFVLV